MTRRRRRRRSHSSESEEPISPLAEEIHAEAEADASVEEPVAHWLANVIAGLPVLLCFLGTGRSAWVPGIAALVIGLLALLFPPKNKLPFLLLMVVGAIALPGLVSLLPIELPFLPAWRETLVRDLQLPVDKMITPQPWVTLENAVWIIVILLWFCWGASHWQTSHGRGAVIRRLALGFTGLALACIFFRLIGWEPAFWEWREHKDMGPFANRNHISGLMAINSVLCLTSAYDLLRRKKRSWLLFGLGVVPSFAVILMVGSRAGLILFGAGLLSWLLAASLRRRSVERLAVSGAVILALTAGAVIFGQKLIARFTHPGVIATENFSMDGRVRVYEEALDLILQHPALGIGLGNFTGVFGMTNKLGDAYMRYRHPESDWLWFMAEAGWPGTLAALIGVFLLLRWMGPWRKVSHSHHRRERRLRLAAGFTSLLLLGHGLVDVPIHNLAIAVLLALLASMALYEKRLTDASGVVMTGAFRLGGLLAVGAGVIWFATGMGLTNIMGQTAAQERLQKTRVLTETDNAAAAWREINQVVEVAPLSWEAWYRRAEIGLRLGHSYTESLRDFTRSRFLEPNMVQNCMIEADVWLKYEPSLAIAAWREALARDSSDQFNRYNLMLRATEFLPELRPGVRGLASSARLLVAYLSYTPAGEEFDATLRELLQRYPTLEGLNNYERFLLFHQWRNKGDRESLSRALVSNDAWLADGWRYVAEDYGIAGKFREAFELAKRFVVPKVNLSSSEDRDSIEQLDREFRFSPSDANRGIRLFIAQRDANRLDDALKTLELMAAQPNFPADVFFETAKIYALKGEYQKAWELTQKYLQH